MLLIAVANVGNLMLAKSEGRRREVAVRMAIGAGQGRLVRQFLTESVLLAGIGGVLGLALGWVGLQVMLAVSPDSIPRIGEIRLDGSVVLFTAAVSLTAGILFGLAPLLHVATDRMAGTLKEGAHHAIAGSARQRVRKGFVAAEVALAVMLAVGAGLLIRSFDALQRVDPGFEPEGLVTFQLLLPESRYEDAGAAGAFYATLLAVQDRVRRGRGPGHVRPPSTAVSGFQASILSRQASPCVRPTARLPVSLRARPSSRPPRRAPGSCLRHSPAVRRRSPAPAGRRSRGRWRGRGW